MAPTRWQFWAIIDAVRYDIDAIFSRGDRGADKGGRWCLSLNRFPTSSCTALHANIHHIKFRQEKVIGHVHHSFIASYKTHGLANVKNWIHRQIPCKASWDSSLNTSGHQSHAKPLSRGAAYTSTFCGGVSQISTDSPSLLMVGPFWGWLAQPDSPIMTKVLVSYGWPGCIDHSSTLPKRMLSVSTTTASGTVIHTSISHM